MLYDSAQWLRWTMHEAGCDSDYLSFVWLMTSSLSAAEELLKRYDWLAQPVSTCLINSSTPLDSSISVMIGCTFPHHPMHSYLASCQHHHECPIGAAADSGSDTSTQAVIQHNKRHIYTQNHTKLANVYMMESKHLATNRAHMEAHIKPHTNTTSSTCRCAPVCS